LLALVISTAAIAQAEQLSIKTYTSAQGLAHNRIARIFRDPQGFLWFCTTDGLSRFDGQQFTNYGFDEGLSFPEFNYFLAAQDGTYWVATNGSGICRFNYSPIQQKYSIDYHSFVESPDMMNVYNGNVTTDSSGEAVITLPDYFQALNRDFRYQLTVIGQFAQAIVASEIKDNRFTIKTDYPGVKVSWQVTGIRQDSWANKHRIRVEEDKADRERGFYLYPEAFDQPQEKSVEWARNPELMKQMKEKGQKMK
jgi:hypothetical protein